MGGTKVQLMKNGFLRAVARGILIMLLLAQWSIVSHACTLANTGLPGEASSTSIAIRAAMAIETVQAQASSPIDCASMDGMSAYTQDAMCAEHCSYGDQSDHSAASAVPPVVLSVAYFLEIAPAVCPPRRTSTELAHALALGSPSYAILYCVRRS